MSEKKEQEHPEAPASGNSKEKPGKPGRPEPKAMQWLGYGIEFMGVMGLFTYAGYWADRAFETTPWLMITGMIVAFTGMIYLLIKETTDWRK